MRRITKETLHPQAANRYNIYPAIQLHAVVFASDYN